MDAVNPIDKLNEVKRLRQALRENPKDIDSQLKLAAFVKDRETKRKLLNVTLSLDPTNKTARDMLLELDRADMGSNYAQTKSSGQVSNSPSVGAANHMAEKTLVFRFSIIPQIVVYSLMALDLLFCWEAIQDPQALIFFGAVLLLLAVPLWSISVVVSVNDSGITISRLFGVVRWEIPWNEIEQIKSNALGGGIKIISKEAKSVKISSQLRGYSAIVEILRSARPDLFDSPASGQAFLSDPASFIEVKIFQQNTLIKYGSFLLGGFACLVSVGALIAQPMVGIVVVAFIALLWFTQLNSPHTVAVEGNRLSAKSTLKKEEWTAAEIKDIRMGYTRSRYGFKRNFIRVETLGGRSFRLAGFAGGDELMYGFLKSWWNTYRSK